VIVPCSITSFVFLSLVSDAPIRESGSHLADCRQLPGIVPGGPGKGKAFLKFQHRCHYTAYTIIMIGQRYCREKTSWSEIDDVEASVPIHPGSWIATIRTGVSGK
jgi:hypothetical protein